MDKHTAAWVAPQQVVNEGNSYESSCTTAKQGTVSHHKQRELPEFNMSHMKSRLQQLSLYMKFMCCMQSKRASVTVELYPKGTMTKVCMPSRYSGLTVYFVTVSLYRHMCLHSMLR